MRTLSHITVQIIDLALDGNSEALSLWIRIRRAILTDRDLSLEEIAEAEQILEGAANVGMVDLSNA